MPQAALILDGGPLSLLDVELVARRQRQVKIGANTSSNISKSRAIVEKSLANDDGGSSAPVYGVNTGFGSLSRARIKPHEIRQVQRNLVRSHAAGVGPPLDDGVVRAMLLILAASLCRGCSGVRLELVQAIIDLLNHQVTPLIPSRGSVGASGDLAPLAHAALVLIGEGHAAVDGKTVPGGEALASVGMSPVTLEAKEGLALINGTHLMCAQGALALCDVDLLWNAAIGAAAMAIDACRATDAFLDERLHRVRNQEGQQQVAALLRDMIKGSQIVTSHKENDPRVQDPYCLRAMPQVLGAAYDTIEHVRNIFERELGAVTDNPLVFAETSKAASIVSGGNFHGMPLAIALDALKIALCHIAGISERRVFWALSATDSENKLPAYLSPQPGLHSGLMIVQYTAAACCNELQTLCAPASVANISTSAGIEDYNSMGATSALQARRAVELAMHVIAIELLVMSQALEHHRPLRSGNAIEHMHALVRTVVPRLTEDRSPAADIAAIAELIRRGRLTARENTPLDL